MYLFLLSAESNYYWFGSQLQEINKMGGVKHELEQKPLLSKPRSSITVKVLCSTHTEEQTVTYQTGKLAC
jgi:hypothetical protein